MNLVITLMMWAAMLLGITVLAAGLVALIRPNLRAGLRRMFLVTLALGAAPTVSLSWTLITDPEPLLGSGANWARNHGLGRAVDRIETWRYSEPPSTIPADELDLALPTPVTTTAASTPTTTSTTAATGPSSTTEAPTTTTTLYAPVALTPVVDPALDGEGLWQPLADPVSPARMWVAALRPLADYPSVTATVITIDQTDLRFVLHNGTELPGGTWEAGARLDTSPAAGAIAAFNGGFRFEHIDGGYVTEGVVVEPLVEGEATLAIDPDGRLHVGVWGDDLDPAADWASVRQSLPPIVHNGENMVRGTWAELWGVDHGNVTFVFRSAICLGPAGELIYAVAGDVDGALMADVMISLGCDTAMQLDINGNWPQFAAISGFGSDNPELVLVDRRMSNQWRYLNGSKKDFIGIYTR